MCSGTRVQSGLNIFGSSNMGTRTTVVFVQFVWDEQGQERRWRSPLMKRSKRETPAVKLFPHFETREQCLGLLHLPLFTSSLFTCGLSHGWLTPRCHTLVPGMIIIARTTNMFSLKLFRKWSDIWTGNWNSWMDECNSTQQLSHPQSTVQV